MAWSSTEGAQAGFATPTAVILSLAIALVATATTLGAVAQLHRARSDLMRTQAEYGLDGAQQLAALTTLGSSNPGALRWTLATDLGPVEALAEPEASKLGLVSAAALSDAVLKRLSVDDPPQLRARLAQIASTRLASAEALTNADTSPVWRECASSIVSPLGRATKLVLLPASPPVQGQFSGRAGQLWRIKVSSRQGWTDDRTLMFTGDGLHPTAIMERRFMRGTGRREPCDVILSGADRP